MLIIKPGSLNINEIWIGNEFQQKQSDWFQLIVVWWRQMTSAILILHDGPKSLHEPTLTNHRRGQSSKDNFAKMFKKFILDMSLKIINPRLQPLLPVAAFTNMV